jgi:hypothetical protein
VQWFHASRQTINIRRTLEIYTKDAPRGQSKNEDVVGNLARHEIRGDVELQLNSFDVEDGKGRLDCAPCAQIGSNISCVYIQRHRAVVQRFQCIVPQVIMELKVVALEEREGACGMRTFQRHRCSLAQPCSALSSLVPYRAALCNRHSDKHTPPDVASLSLHLAGR